MGNESKQGLFRTSNTIINSQVFLLMIIIQMLMELKTQMMPVTTWVSLETEKGYVLIDHKDYPGKEPEERAKQYTPQLSTYKEAVEKSTGKPVIEILIHML